MQNDNILSCVSVVCCQTLRSLFISSIKAFLFFYLCVDSTHRNATSSLKCWSLLSFLYLIYVVGEPVTKSLFLLGTPGKIIIRKDTAVTNITIALSLTFDPCWDHYHRHGTCILRSCVMILFKSIHRDIIWRRTKLCCVFDTGCSNLSLASVITSLYFTSLWSLLIFVCLFIEIDFDIWLLTVTFILDIWC